MNGRRPLARHCTPPSAGRLSSALRRFSRGPRGDDYLLAASAMFGAAPAHHLIVPSAPAERLPCACWLCHCVTATSPLHHCPLTNQRPPHSCLCYSALRPRLVPIVLKSSMRLMRLSCAAAQNPTAPRSLHTTRRARARTRRFSQALAGASRSRGGRDSGAETTISRLHRTPRKNRNARTNGSGSAGGR